MQQDFVACETQCLGWCVPRSWLEPGMRDPRVNSTSTVSMEAPVCFNLNFYPFDLMALTYCSRP